MSSIRGLFLFLSTWVDCNGSCNAQLVLLSFAIKNISMYLVCVSIMNRRRAKWSKSKLCLIVCQHWEYWKGKNLSCQFYHNCFTWVLTDTTSPSYPGASEEPWPESQQPATPQPPLPLVQSKKRTRVSTHCSPPWDRLHTSIASPAGGHSFPCPAKC